MSKLDPIKGGRTSCIQNRHEQRFLDDGKLCYGCNKVRDFDFYYKNISQCKSCCQKKEKAQWKKQKQPLW